MKREQFRFLIDTETVYEFKYKEKNYSISYGKDEKGSYIAFGERYLQEKYYSYGEFMNNARVENSFFREMIEDLELPSSLKNI